MKLKITGSIVLYKNNVEVRNVIRNFLDTSLDLRLYLIDNSPNKSLLSLLEDFISLERVTYIFNNANLGFGAAHNIAIREALQSSDYHLVVNPDVSFGSEVIGQLISYMEQHRDVGLIMPRVVYPGGELQYACKLLPTPADLIFRRFFPRSWFKKRADFFEMRHTGYNKIMEVPYLSGCFMLLRTSALKEVGLFDERFFMYPEDIDLTRRMNEKYKTIFYPAVSITHEHTRGSYKSIKLLIIHIVNMIRYFNKWGWFLDKQRNLINKRILSQLP